MDRFKQLITDMSIHAQQEYPREVCGIITKDFRYIKCKNISPAPLHSFILDPVALYTNDNNIWGISHSHPGQENPLPSEQDLASTVFDEYKFVVGFAGRYFIYWMDPALKILRYEEFSERHINETG